MRVHIAGIGGTFMGGLALLARALGHDVDGSDGKLYPPMSDQLEAHKIAAREGYLPGHLDPAPDEVIIGNALSRGNPMIEAVLERALPYRSGPQWLAEQVLPGRHVIAVAGTHGKTSTASMVAWILEQAGLEPGFLIGGVPENFGVSARLGAGRFFVIEADEYDTAFFDKRSKFVHYRPRTCVLNNLEFDHADIFPDLEAIATQFHHLIRTVPGNGKLIVNQDDHNLRQVLERGCWSPVEGFARSGEAAPRWHIKEPAADFSTFRVYDEDAPAGEVHWELIGRHNALNALAAVAAANAVGVTPEAACEALAGFHNVKRRLELLQEHNGVRLYDDFAHHPTAVRATLEALRTRVGTGRILAVLEPRSNTMRLGVHKVALADALRGADQVYLFRPPDLSWNLTELTGELNGRAGCHHDLDRLASDVCENARPGDHIVLMSNGSFGNLRQDLARRLRSAPTR